MQKWMIAVSSSDPNEDVPSITVLVDENGYVASVVEDRDEGKGIPRFPHIDDYLQYFNDQQTRCALYHWRDHHDLACRIEPIQLSV